MPELGAMERVVTPEDIAFRANTDRPNVVMHRVNLLKAQDGGIHKWYDFKNLMALYGIIEEQRYLYVSYNIYTKDNFGTYMEPLYKLNQVLSVTKYATEQETAYFEILKKVENWLLAFLGEHFPRARVFK